MPIYINFTSGADDENLFYLRSIIVFRAGYVSYLKTETISLENTRVTTTREIETKTLKKPSNPVFLLFILHTPFSLQK